MNPTTLKAVAAVAVAWTAQLLYFLMPFDLLPDFIPFAGLIDDGIMLLGTASMTAYGVYRIAASTAEPERQIPTEQQSYEPLDAAEIAGW